MKLKIGLHEKLQIFELYEIFLEFQFKILEQIQGFIIQINCNAINFYLVQLIKQPILQILNFDFPNVRCCKVFLSIVCKELYTHAIL